MRAGDKVGILHSKPTYNYVFFLRDFTSQRNRAQRRPLHNEL